MKKKLYIVAGLGGLAVVAAIYQGVQLTRQNSAPSYEPISKRRALEKQARNLDVQTGVSPDTIVVPPPATPMTGDTTAPSVLGSSVAIDLSTPLLACVNGKLTAKLSWTAGSAVTSYTIEKKPAGGSDASWVAVSPKLPATVLSYTDTNLNQTGSWTYQVHAVASKKNSYSDELTVQGYSCSAAAFSGGAAPQPTPPPAAAAPKPAPTPAPTPVAQPTPAPVSAATVPSTTKLQWGAYVGWRTSDLPAFESTVGKPVNIQATFVHWGNENQFPSELAAPLKASGKTLLIFWEAMDYNADEVNQPNFSYDKILAGNYDTYIKNFAAQAKAYGGQVIVIPFEEANGNWYPWAGSVNGNTPAKHVAAYRRVHDLFAGVSNVKFGWSMNNDSVPDTTANKLENYYPGDAYVDYVGVNGFNFNNPWQTWDQVFGPALTRLAQYNKPTYIFSMASAPGTQKAAWITTGISSSLKKYPKVAGWVWFNENKERDWRVNSDAASLTAFKAALP